MEELKQYLPALKAVNSLISKQELIIWFNENDVDYYNMTDMEMYIYYIEKA